jgi:hypothetical protein
MRVISPELQRRPESMARHVPAILGYLIHVDSFLAMAGIAIVLASLEWIGDLPSPGTELAYPAARVLWGAYFFLVARKASKDKLRLPVPSDLRDLREFLLRPLVQVGLATLPYWLALLIAIQVTVGLEDFVFRFRNQPLDFMWHRGALGYVMLGVGVLYIPLAVVAALSSGRRVLRLADPTRGLRLIWRNPELLRCYAVMFAILCTFIVAGFALDALGRQIVAALPIPLAAPVIRYLMRLWVTLAQARLVGGFVHHNRAHLE